jgi:hypothetical protein
MRNERVMLILTIFDLWRSNRRVCASCGEPWLTADERMMGAGPAPLSLSQASDSSGSGSGSGTSGAAAARSRKRSRR